MLNNSFIYREKKRSNKVVEMLVVTLMEGWPEGSIIE